MSTTTHNLLPKQAILTIIGVTNRGMNKKKRMVQGALALGVMIVGLYMLFTHTWGTPPAVSGLGFLMAGLALWVPHCPVMRMLFGD